LGFGVKDANVACGVSNENEISEEVDAAYYTIVLVIWLLKELFLDLVELGLDDKLLVHVVVLLLERQQLSSLLCQLVRNRIILFFVLFNYVQHISALKSLS
jgi:hypothetical protein